MKTTHLLFSLSISLSGLRAQAASTDTNKAWALAALQAIMVHKDVAAVDTFFAEPFLEHTPGLDNGLPALRALVASLANNPNFHYEAVRAVAQGDWVAIHGRYVGWLPQPAVAVDLFRLKNGKIVEHADGIALEALPNPSGHTMLDGTTDILHQGQTASSAALVRDFVETILIHGAVERLPDYFHGDQYIQHNPLVGDGVASLQQFLQTLSAQGITLRYTHLERVLAEGDFVLAQSTGELGGQPHAFFDFFRGVDGKLAEHWDVIQPLPQEPG